MTVPSWVPRSNGTQALLWLNFAGNQYWANPVVVTSPVQDDPNVTPSANPKPGWFLDQLGLNVLVPNPCVRLTSQPINTWNTVLAGDSGFSLACQVNLSDSSEGSLLLGFSTFNQQTAHGYQSLSLDLDMDIPGNTYGGELTWEDLAVPETLPINIGDGSIDNPIPPGGIITFGVTVRNSPNSVSFWVDGVLQGSVTPTNNMAALNMCEVVKHYTPPTFNGVTNGNNLGALVYLAIMAPVSNPTLVFPSKSQGYVF